MPTNNAAPKVCDCMGTPCCGDGAFERRMRRTCPVHGDAPMQTVSMSLEDISAQVLANNGLSKKAQVSQTAEDLAWKLVEEYHGPYASHKDEFMKELSEKIAACIHQAEMRGARQALENLLNPRTRKIKSYLSEHQSASVRDIMNYIGAKSPSVVQWHLNKLAEVETAIRALSPTAVVGE